MGERPLVIHRTGDRCMLMSFQLAGSPSAGNGFVPTCQWPSLLHIFCTAMKILSRCDAAEAATRCGTCLVSCLWGDNICSWTIRIFDLLTLASSSSATDVLIFTHFKPPFEQANTSLELGWFLRVWWVWLIVGLQSEPWILCCILLFLLCIWIRTTQQYKMQRDTTIQMGEYVTKQTSLVFLLFGCISLLWITWFVFFALCMCNCFSWLNLYY